MSDKTAFQAGRIARAKALGQASASMSVALIVRGQCSWSQVIQGGSVVCKERLGTKRVRLGHAEELDLMDVSPRRVST